jgi:hypothetical protein
METPPEQATEQMPEAPNELEAAIKKYLPDVDTTDLNTAALEAITRLGGIHDKLFDVVSEYPEFGQAIAAMLKGMNPSEAIARYMDIEEPPEDAPDYGTITKAKEEVKKSKAERQATLASNEQMSIKNIADFKEKSGLDDATSQVVMDKLYTIYEDIRDLNIKPETMEMVYKGLKADADVKAARESGEIAGRNQQIEKKRTGAETGDGVPKLSNTGGSMEPAKKKSFAGSFMKGVI